MQNTVRVSVQLPQSVSDAIATMQRAAPGKVPPVAAVARELIERGLAAGDLPPWLDFDLVVRATANNEDQGAIEGQEAKDVLAFLDAMVKWQGKVRA